MSFHHVMSMFSLGLWAKGRAVADAPDEPTCRLGPGTPSVQPDSPA